jgi:glycerol-3-phosphate acyltransferase PlsY
MHEGLIILIAIIAYFIGSVPFGIVLAKLFGLPDPRTIGSGNIGATNMLRTGRKDIAALTMLLDGGKGMMAVWLASYLLSPNPQSPIPNPAVEALALAAAAFGHMASNWLKFKGGKGVATLLFGTLAFSWPVGASICCIWMLITFTTRYVALASIGAIALLPLAVWLRVDATSAIIIATACAFAIYKHRSNLARLRAGTEPKISFGKEKKNA